MSWVDKLERRYGRYGIPNLTSILVVCQAAVWAVIWFVNQNVWKLLMLNRSMLLRGQLWRLVTFLALPTSTDAFSFLLGAYFLWFIGSALEQHWGDFRYTLYLLLGTAGCILAALITGGCGNGYLYASLFLAFAMRFPEQQLLLFFVLPIKAKWLGAADGVLLALALITSGWAGRVQILLSLLGFVLFFGGDLLRDLRARYRRAQWRRQNRNNWR